MFHNRRYKVYLYHYVIINSEALLEYIVVEYTWKIPNFSQRKNYVEVFD